MKENLEVKNSKMRNTEPLYVFRMFLGKYYKEAIEPGIKEGESAPFVFQLGK